MTIAEAERTLILATLAANGGNRTRTAKDCGVSLRTIRNKLQTYGVTRVNGTEVHTAATGGECGSAPALHGHDPRDGGLDRGRAAI